MSLLKKLMLAYSVLILIPAIIAGYLSYSQARANLESEIRKSTEQTLLQVKNNIDFKVAVAENIVDKIAYNTEIQYFLAKNFEMTPDQFSNYLENIKPLISEAANLNQINVYRLSIFTNNTSIPEGWGLFFSSSRIEGFDWYTNLAANSVETETWLQPHRESEYNPGILNNDNVVFTLVKKIYLANRKYLGVVTLDVLESEMFSSIGSSRAGGETILALGPDNSVLYTSQAVDGQAESQLLSSHKTSGSGNFIHGNNLYVYDGVDALGMQIAIKVPMGNMLSSAQAAGKNIVLVVFVSFILFIIFTYLVIRIVFGRLNRIVKVMNSVAQGDFDTRIQMDGHDEVGQLAGDFNILIEKINVLMQDIIRRETAQKDAQLIALQYQINPHFIYNMIDVFRMKMELAGDYETAGAITDFGKMLRYNINSKSMYATLADELDNVRKYIGLQRLRYGNRINFIENLSGVAENVTVIKFILQPIVENSIRHGFVSSKASLDIGIDLQMDGNVAVVTIEDNGEGISAERLDELNRAMKLSAPREDSGIGDRGIGLMNINDRIKLFYGAEYCITLESAHGEYTRTILKFPQNAGG